MSRIQTILVPLDSGAPSEGALAYAAELAEDLNARIIVLHAFELPVTFVPEGVMVGSPSLTSSMVGAVQAALDEAIAEHASKHVSMTTLLRCGDPREVILEVATEFGVDLIVMGTHGRRGFTRAMMGSVAESVVRASRVPVLTMHAEPRAAASAAA